MDRVPSARTALPCGHIEKCSTVSKRGVADFGWLEESEKSGAEGKRR